MTLAAAFLAAALVVPSLPPPEHDDCEVVTNCVFDASRSDAKESSVRVELRSTSSRISLTDYELFSGCIARCDGF